MTTNHEELCERLRGHANDGDWPMQTFAEAAGLIEAQAARIKQQALEYTSLFDQCSEALERVKVLEAQIAAAKEQEPIYQVWNERTGFYADVTAEYYAERLPSNRRKLYAHPPIDTASEDASLIREAYEFTWYVAAAFSAPREWHRDIDGNVYYIHPTTEDWWDGLREDLDALQPKLAAAIAAVQKERGE